MPKKTPEQRFFEKIRIDPETGCWIWTAAKNLKGCGIFRINQKNIFAHHFAWKLYNGKINENDFIKHKCNNYSCVNPDHLYIYNHSNENRFWKRVKKTSTCWNWIGYKNPQGYGRFWVNKKMVRTYRFSYELHFGPIQKNKFVCHKCDNPSCVNPNHLWLGTVLDNSNDMINKNRDKKARGEKNCNSKLTKEQVLKIRSEYIPRKVSAYKLAKKYNVNVNTIQKILYRKLWTHI